MESILFLIGWYWLILPGFLLGMVFLIELPGNIANRIGDWRRRLRCSREVCWMCNRPDEAGWAHNKRTCGPCQRDDHAFLD